jgi:predicted neuraminidase
MAHGGVVRRNLIVLFGGLAIGLAVWIPALAAAERGLMPRQTNVLVKGEFIYERAPFPECHASTLAETSDGLIAAWFGGTAEGKSDVGIWLSRHEDARWSAPVEVANGVQADGKRQPCWNPVLFQPRQGPLLLFYKVGPSPSRWWGMLMTSADAGRTWSRPRRLPDGILGPIKNKPVDLADGTILCGSSTEYDGWRVHFERTRDLGQTWEKTPPINERKEFGAIQPTILTHPSNRLQALCRSTQGRITESWSGDSGRTWGPMQATSQPNPNSGIDAVTLADGRYVLVYNPTRKGRTPLSVSISKDGKNWEPLATLEDQPGEYSYPAVVQTRDGQVHISYTWKRQRVRHVALELPR